MNKLFYDRINLSEGIDVNKTQVHQHSVLFATIGNF